LEAIRFLVMTVFLCHPVLIEMFTRTSLRCQRFRRSRKAKSSSFHFPRRVITSANMDQYATIYRYFGDTVPKERREIVSRRSRTGSRHRRSSESGSAVKKNTAKSGPRQNQR